MIAAPSRPDASLQLGRLPDGTFFLDAVQRLPRSLDEVFAFFADARNLEKITPPWLHFQILTPDPIEMKEGALIDYRLRLHGMPLRWRTAIRGWTPPTGFVDEQVRGPYLLWRHEHAFKPCPGGVEMTDRVLYRVPGGWPVQKWFVAPQLRAIFGYRRTAIEKLLGPPPPETVPLETPSTGG